MFLAGRVFQEDAELASLILERTAAQYQAAVESPAVPVIGVGAVSALIYDALSLRLAPSDGLS